jgi:hypothetical protein
LGEWIFNFLDAITANAAFYHIGIWVKKKDYYISFDLVIIKNVSGSFFSQLRLNGKFSEKRDNYSSSGSI